jgi:hypothetical protein
MSKIKIYTNALWEEMVLSGDTPKGEERCSTKAGREYQAIFLDALELSSEEIWQKVLKGSYN